MSDDKSRLVIEIDKSLHYSIKRLALEQRTTIKNWLMEAIARKMDNDERVKDDE